MSAPNIEQGSHEYADNHRWQDIHAVARYVMSAYAHTAMTDGQWTRVEWEWNDQNGNGTYYLLRDRDDMGAKYQLVRRAIVARNSTGELDIADGHEDLVYSFRPAMQDITYSDKLPIKGIVKKCEGLAEVLLTANPDIAEARENLARAQQENKSKLSAERHKIRLDAMFNQIVKNY